MTARHYTKNKIHADNHNKRKTFHASRPQLVACFAIIFLHCGKSLHSWYETERQRHFW